MGMHDLLHLAPHSLLPTCSYTRSACGTRQRGRGLYKRAKGRNMRRTIPLCRSFTVLVE